MPPVTTIPSPLPPGRQLQDGSALDAAMGSQATTVQDGIVALAGGGQSASTPVLIYGENHVITTATTSDSVMMPPSYAGAKVEVLNSGAQTMRIFANTQSSLGSGVQDTINGTAGATGITVAAGLKAELVCYTVGSWFGPVAKS